MKFETNEDSLVCEIPVFLTKTLAGQLHIFQYPVRPNTHTYDEESIVKARVKSESKQVELELGLHTKAPVFDRGKGEQIAINVDGACKDQKDSDENYFRSNTMDKLILASTKALSNVDRYAFGVMGEGSLHLTPLTSVLTFRPSFSYLDMADKRSKHETKEHSDDSDNEEKLKTVTVRFEKHDDRSKAMKEKSYSYLQKKIQEDPWISVQYDGYGSAKSDFESRHLYCVNQIEEEFQFNLNDESYLKNLIPQNAELTVAITPIEVTLQDRIRDVMINAIVTSFDELVEAVSPGKKNDHNSILKMVQEVAVLVQGNWVVKSDYLYPKDAPSESLISNGIIQRARDYTLYLFTKNKSITRSDVTDTVDVPAEELTNILKGVSKSTGTKGCWEFLLPQDNYFLKSHSDVYQRQQMIWQLCYDRLSRTFKKPC